LGSSAVEPMHFPTDLLNMVVLGTNWHATLSRGKTLVSSCCSSFPLTSCAQQYSMYGREKPLLEDSLQWIGSLDNNQGKSYNHILYVDLIINGRVMQ